MHATRSTLVVAGVDVGSLSAKAVVLDAERRVLGTSIIPTGRDARKAGMTCLELARREAVGSAAEIAAIVATGYGRVSLDFTTSRVTEITCHARGAAHYFPDVKTVIDIGGQDSKVIRVGRGGRVVDFVMNDKCAAGTGRFLEVMARALETDVSEMGKLAAGDGRVATISSMCTVFAESEVVSLIAAGTPADEIARGIHEAVAERVAAMAQRLGVEEPVVMTGGVAKNEGVVRALEAKLGCKILVPQEPQIVGALGAALVGAEALGGR